MSVPWAVQESDDGLVGGWGAVPGWLPPGPMAAALRAEAQARRAERREQEQREARVEARRTQAVALAHQFAVMAGQPWSPGDPFRSWPSPATIMEATFAAQDREAKRHEFQAAKEAGLVHVVNLSPDMVALEPAEAVEDRKADSELHRAHHRTHLEGVRAAARRALARVGRR